MSKNKALKKKGEHSFKEFLKSNSIQMIQKRIACSYNYCADFPGPYDHLLGCFLLGPPFRLPTSQLSFIWLFFPPSALSPTYIPFIIY
jgi:hypothetical protein